MAMTEEVNKNELLLYGEIFYQLIQLSWFKELIETRIDIHKVIDKKNKSIEIKVIEVPTEEMLKRLNKKQRQVSESNVVSPTSGQVVQFNKNIK